MEHVPAGDDPRRDMDYETPYIADGVGDCSVGACSNPGATVTKHHWANRPKGQLYTRCEEHQRFREAELRAQTWRGMHE